MAADIKADYPFATYVHLADAILALLPGRTEAEVAAATLRAASEALDAMQTPEAGLPPEIRRDPALWLILRADEVERGPILADLSREGHTTSPNGDGFEETR